MKQSHQKSFGFYTCRFWGDLSAGIWKVFVGFSQKDSSGKATCSWNVSLVQYNWEWED